MEKTLAIQYMYPNAVIFVDFSVVNDGSGNETIDMWNLSNPQPTDTDLQTAWIGYCKQNKISELNDSCQNTIYSGFTGTNGHKYQFGEKDQGNLTQQMLFIVNDTTITSVQWKTEDVGILSHTRADFLQVCLDADNFKRSNFGKYWNLESQVNAATTEDAINAITW